VRIKTTTIQENGDVSAHHRTFPSFNRRCYKIESSFPWFASSGA
jgi:hypothetical protein